MKLNVPYYSQYSAEVPEDWQPRSCGIVALRMALAFVTHAAPTPQDLINEGVARGAYLSGIGWKHDGLVSLAEKYGARAHRREFKGRRGTWRLVMRVTGAVHARQGLSYLRRALKEGTVPIVSIRVEGSRDTHLVPLVGFDQHGFTYHEPAAEDGANRTMTTTEFLHAWRRLAIFVAPRQVTSVGR